MSKNLVSARAQLKVSLPNRGDAARLAERLGVHPSMVTRWLQGTRLPNTAQRVYLFEQYQIPILLWDSSSDVGLAAA